MRLITAFSLALLGCNGDDPTKDAGVDTGTEPPPTSFRYSSEAVARGFDAVLADDAIAAHRMSSTFLAAAALVASDDKSQDRLVTDGDVTAASQTEPRALFECWERPEFPMWSFDINFEPCAKGFEISGGATVDDHPSGPLLFTYNSLTIRERSIGGTLALDRRAGLPNPLFWGSYNTESVSPGLDNPVPLGITTDGVTSGATWIGGSAVNFLNQTWTMWGTLTVTLEGREFSIVHGGVTPSDVAPDRAPGPNAVSNPLNWLECRCPTSGLSTYQLALEFAEVQVDLDDIEAVDDQIDDPVLTLPVQHLVEGSAQVNYVACGEQTVSYDVPETTLVVPRDIVTARMSYLCDIREVPDLGRCLKIVDGLRQAGDLTVTISQADVEATAQRAVQDSFDTAWCRY